MTKEGEESDGVRSPGHLKRLSYAVVGQWNAGPCEKSGCIPRCKCSSIEISQDLYTSLLVGLFFSEKCFQISYNAMNCANF